MRELGGLAVDVPGDDDEVSVWGHQAPPHRLTHLQRLARAVSQELSQMLIFQDHQMLVYFTEQDEVF